MKDASETNTMIKDGLVTVDIGSLFGEAGICDYCDSHKNDDWQKYASIVAAAYTRALIETMPVQHLNF